MCQGFTQTVREPMVVKIVDLMRGAQEGAFPIDVAVEFLASTSATPTRQRTATTVATGTTVAPSSGVATSSDVAQALVPTGGGNDTPLATPEAVNPGGEDGDGNVQDMNVDNRAAAKRRLEFDVDIDVADAGGDAEELDVVSELVNVG